MRVARCFVVGVLLVACQRSNGPQDQRSSQSDATDTSDSTTRRQQPHAVLVDSVRYENDLTEGYLCRVAVYTARGVDTLHGVLTTQEPIVVGDSMIYGIAQEEHLISDGYAYDARTGTLQRLALPADLARLAFPALSPDGQHLAYLAVDSAGFGYATIAAWPSRRIIYRGPAADLLETDAGVDFISWQDAHTFDIRLDLTVRLDRRTQRVRGDVEHLDGVQIDTIARATNPT